MKNYLIHRKRRFFKDGGLSGYNPNGVNWNNSTTLTQSYAPTKPADILATEKKYDIKIDPNQNLNNIDQTLGKDLNLQGTKGGVDVGGAISGGVQAAETIYEAAQNGANNWDRGKFQTQDGQFKSAQEQANNVSQTYTAGQNKLNTLSRTGSAASVKDLKTHKGWKNVLGSAGKGAAVGASIGNLFPGPGTAIGAVVGTVVGAAAAGIGEFFGWRKRKKKAQKLAEEKKAADFAIDYYNQKQAEQLASANDQAAKVQADQNRQSVLTLAAYGGRLKRNYLLSKRNF